MIELFVILICCFMLLLVLAVMAYFLATGIIGSLFIFAGFKAFIDGIREGIKKSKATPPSSSSPSPE